MYIFVSCEKKFIKHILELEHYFLLLNLYITMFRILLLNQVADNLQILNINSKYGSICNETLSFVAPAFRLLMFLFWFIVLKFIS